LLADAGLASFKPEEYYPDLRVVLKPDGKPQSFAAIKGVSGQLILEGESGLSKTMYLRNVARNAKGPLVYLLAQRCNGGVIEAIQNKLHGYAQDKTFLESLVFSGGLDVCIDGLNEVSPDTRANVTSFLETYFESNSIVGTQPLEWTPPKKARVFVAQRLTREQVETFLLGREPFLPNDAVCRGDDYKCACDRYLASVFAPENHAELEDAERMLSNPMDLWTVAELIARGERPDLFRLQEQDYEIMANDYKRINVGRDFPLERFSEHCYELRMKDEVAISEELFQQELLCMERHKLVVKRQSTGTDESVKTQWFFRHDKIAEFFIVQTFLGRNNPRPVEHMADARFRGVLLLLATLLPLDAADSLREQIVLYAAKTKDHTVNDDFVQLLLMRKTRESVVSRTL
jgi:hypothetical protein